MDIIYDHFLRLGFEAELKDYRKARSRREEVERKIGEARKEFDELIKNKSADYIVSQINGDLFHWKAIIKGSPDTVYEGRKFQIDIMIPDEYTYQPPKLHHYYQDEI